MLAHVSPHAESTPSERGETLIELLIAIVLMGTAIAALLEGLFALTQVSQLNTRITSSNSALQSYAEQVKQSVAPLAYKPCASKTAYDSGIAATIPAGTFPSGLTAKVVQVDWLASKTLTSSQYTWTTSATNTHGVTVGSCPSTTVDLVQYDLGMQRLWLEVDSPTDKHYAKELVVVVKRDARCPPNYDNADQGPC